MTSEALAMVAQNPQFFMVAVNCMRNNLAIRNRLLHKSREARQLSATRGNLSKLMEEAARRDNPENLTLMLEQLDSQQLTALEAESRLFRKMHDALVKTYDQRRTTEILAQAAKMKKGKTHESARVLRQG